MTVVDPRVEAAAEALYEHATGYSWALINEVIASDEPSPSLDATRARWLHSASLALAAADRVAQDSGEQQLPELFESLAVRIEEERDGDVFNDWNIALMKAATMVRIQGEELAQAAAEPVEWLAGEQP